jgi:hypothetical protein
MKAYRIELLSARFISMDSSLKGQCHEIFCFRFFHESFSPKPLKITLGSFRIFSKIRGDIRKSRCTTGIRDTGGKQLEQYQIAGNLK